MEDDGELAGIVAQVIADNPDVVERIKGGNAKAMGALVGPIMKAKAAAPTAARSTARSASSWESSLSGGAQAFRAEPIRGACPWSASRHRGRWR